MYRVLVVADERPGGAAAGPGLRVQAMADLLGKEHAVTILGARGRTRDVNRAIAENDVTVCRPGLLGARQLLEFRRTEKFLVVDLSIPQPVEGMCYFAPMGDEGVRRYGAAQRRLRRTLLAGDFFVAAHETQRSFWLGALLTQRDLPLSYVAADPSFANFVGLAPTGIPAEAPPDRAPDGDCLLWGGGPWDWLDPVLLLEALADVRAGGRTGAYVVVPGTRHPDPLVPLPRQVAELEAARERLGLPADALRMQEGWSTGAQRMSYLQKARIGVSLHRPGLEAALSWRHRILDYLWAGLPTVLTAGCPLADRVAAADAGLVVPPGDRTACARAIGTLLVDEERYERCHRAAMALAADLTSERLLEPLVAFCRAPRKAPDHGSAAWTRLVRMVIA